MPKKGLARQADVSPSGVRERLIDAGAEVLLESGFLGASARAIAQRAGVATGSVHYHFASVEELLLASLERSTAQRSDEYRRIKDEAGDLASLLSRVVGEFAADREAGRFRLLAQLMAGADTNSVLAAAVADRTQPWIDLAAEGIERFLGSRPLGAFSAEDLALAIVALFIGLELLDHVDPARFDATGLLNRAALVAHQFGDAASLWASRRD